MRNLNLRRFRLSAAVILPALLISAAAVLSAGNPQAQPKAGGPLMTVDFRAATEEGQPVLDLKPGDVALKVNGRARDIRSLTLIQVTPASGAAAAAPPAAPFASNGPDSFRDVFVVVDADSIARGVEQPVRDAVTQLLEGLTPRDRVTLITIPASSGATNIPLTTDHARIRAALGAITGQALAGQTEADIACRTQITLQSLEAVLGSMSSGGPATVVFYSSGLLGPGGDSAAAKMGQDSGACQIRTANFNSVAAAASASRANLFVVFLLDSAAAGSGFTNTTALAAGVESVAGVTAGELIRVTGSSATAMARLARETSAYYVASFDPDPADRTGAAVEVKLVGRDRVNVRARPRLPMARPEARRGAAARDMLKVASIYRDLPIRLAAFASKNRGDDKVRIVALFEPAEPSTALASAAIGIFDEKGKLVEQATTQPSDLAHMPVMLARPVPPGNYRVRVAGVDGSGRGGTADYDIRAEVVRADPLELSALVLGVPANGAFAPRLQFGADPAAVAMLEIYGAGKSAGLTASLELAESEDGPALGTALVTISPPNSNNPDVRIAYGGFSIAPLPAGDFVVRAVVSIDGKPVGRATRTLRKAAS